MNFLEKLLKPTPKSDPFGIDSAINGIRALQARITADMCGN